MISRQNQALERDSRSERLPDGRRALGTVPPEMRWQILEEVACGRKVVDVAQEYGLERLGGYHAHAHLVLSQKVLGLDELGLRDAIDPFSPQRTQVYVMDPQFLCRGQSGLRLRIKQGKASIALYVLVTPFVQPGGKYMGMKICDHRPHYTFFQCS